MTQSEQKKALEEGEEFLAGRLIKKAEADELGAVELSPKSDTLDDRGELVMQTEEKISEFKSNGQDTAETATVDSKIVVPTFTKVEKSLASLGFFTPSSRRLKDQKVKRISFTREVDGKRVEVTAEIIPSALYGLPITADQDKYLALQEIITNILQSEGVVKNPIRFKSADLLRLMNRNVKAGKNYKEIGAWLDVMFSTTIFSQGTVYKAGEKRFAKDRFRVFDRAISVGKELEDGTIADANYVWLSAWQLDNINHNFLLPIDLKTYRELKNHIAKALVPLLQIWLFASQRAGSFEKRYDELCEILSLQIYKAPSLITRQLKPSLDELTHYEYLEKWRIEKTADRKAYKVIFFHGSKFHRDRRRRLEQKSQMQPTVVIAESQPPEPNLPEPGKLEVDPKTSDVTAPAVPTPTPTLADQPEAPPTKREAAEQKIIAALTDRGIFETAARKLLAGIPVERRETAADYIDYWDSIPPEKRGPGLLHSLIQNGDPLPSSFETRRKREARVAAQARNEKLRLLKGVIADKYEEHQEAAVDRFIAEQITTEEFERRVAVRKAELSKQKNLWDGREFMRSELAEKIARSAVRDKIAREEVPIISFEDFQKRELPRILDELKLDPAELGIELAVKPDHGTIDQPNSART